MTKEELEKATGQELIDERDYCGVDGYYGDYLDDVNAEMLKRFNHLAELEEEKQGLKDYCDKYTKTILSLRKNVAELEASVVNVKVILNGRYKKMTKEELKKKAEELSKVIYGYINEPYIDGYLDGNNLGAEPREKRIEELEAQVEKMKSCVNCRYCINEECPWQPKGCGMKHWELRR